MTIFEENRDLLGRFRDGDAAALTDVYRRYVGDVAALARQGFVQDAGGRVPGVRDAESERDVVQEVFVRAFSPGARASYDGLRPYRPYLLRIARNLMIDRLRKQGREELADDVGEEGAALGGDELAGASAEEALDWSKQLAATQRFLARQSPKLRTFVRLRYEEGRSQAELVGDLGVSRWRIRAWERQLERGLVRFLRRERVVEVEKPPDRRGGP